MTKFPRPLHPAPAPARVSPKILTLWKEMLSRAQPEPRLSRDGVEVLRGYNSGRDVFVRLHNISGRKSRSNGLYGH